MIYEKGRITFTCLEPELNWKEVSLSYQAHGAYFNP